MKSLKITLVVAVAALFSFTVVEQYTYSVDTVHSRIGFSIKHLGINDQNGSFDKFDTKITTTKADFSDAVVEFSAEASSVNTGNEMRDGHLQSPDFFDAAKYPTLSFKSTSFKKIKGNEYQIKGDFTFHGVTKPVVLKAIHGGNFENPETKKVITAFKISGVVKRSEHNVAVGFPGLSDEVNLLADLEFARN